MASTRKELINYLQKAPEREEFVLLCLAPNGVCMLSTKDRTFIDDSLTTFYNLLIKDRGGD